MPDTYPWILLAIEPDGMYLVALDQDWGRILNRQQQRYYPRVRIGNALVMTGPWDDYTGSQDVLPEWLAEAEDMEVASHA